MAQQDASKKKYVTRACDACKRRKSKCDGGEPCSRCVASCIECAYKSSYNRVKRRKLSEHPTVEGTPQRVIESATTELFQANIERRSGQFGASVPTAVQEEGYDDASVHAFLRNVYSHLGTMGQAMPRNLSRPAEHTLDAVSGGATFVLPPKDVGKLYLDCVFEHSNATYRYLPLRQTYDMLEGLYHQDPAVIDDSNNMAVILLALSLGCIWSASWKSKNVDEYRVKASRLYQAGKSLLEEASAVYPPTIKVLQASVLRCQIELAMNMFNRAWMSVGSAVRLGQIIGFQRASKGYREQDEYSRRGVFWALFMIDRYLSVVLGRPTIIKETDITIPYPEVPKDVHLQPELGVQESKIAAGVVAHIKLTKIVGRIMARLYPAVNHGLETRDVVVAQVERELQEWLEETPSFFHPETESNHATEDSFYDIPWIFRRQQRTIRAAYNFTVMLAYRGYLLDELLSTNFKTPPTGPPSYNILRCVDAALRMARFAGDIALDEKYNGVYWTTSYFIFCAISILVVYLTLYPHAHDQSSTAAIIEKAMEGHKRLDNSRGLTSQKLLEESKVIAENVRAESVAGTSPASRTAQGPRVSVVETSDLTNTTPNEQPPIVVGDFNGSSDLTFNAGGEDFTNDIMGLGPLPDGNALDLIMDLGFDNSMFNLDNYGIDF